MFTFLLPHQLRQADAQLAEAAGDEHPRCVAKCWGLVVAAEGSIGRHGCRRRLGILLTSGWSSSSATAAAVQQANQGLAKLTGY